MLYLSLDSVTLVKALVISSIVSSQHLWVWEAYIGISPLWNKEKQLLLMRSTNNNWSTDTRSNWTPCTGSILKFSCYKVKTELHTELVELSGMTETTLKAVLLPKLIRSTTSKTSSPSQNENFVFSYCPVLSRPGSLVCSHNWGRPQFCEA